MPSGRIFTLIYLSVWHPANAKVSLWWRFWCVNMTLSSLLFASLSGFHQVRKAHKRSKQKQKEKKNNRKPKNWWRQWFSVWKANNLIWNVWTKIATYGKRIKYICSSRVYMTGMAKRNEMQKKMNVRGKRLGSKEQTQSNCVNKFPWEQNEKKKICNFFFEHVRPAVALGMVVWFFGYLFQFCETRAVKQIATSLFGQPQQRVLGPLCLFTWRSPSEFSHM